MMNSGKQVAEAIQIWALRELEGYFIRFVLPAWTLVIDGIACVSMSLYEDVSLSGRQSRT